MYSVMCVFVIVHCLCVIQDGNRHRNFHFNCQVFSELAPCGPGAIRTPPYPFTSPLSALSYSIFYFSFSYSLFSIFLLFHPFSFYQNSFTLVGCRRRQLNLALDFCFDFVLYVFF